MLPQFWFVLFFSILLFGCTGHLKAELTALRERLNLEETLLASCTSRITNSMALQGRAV